MARLLTSRCRKAKGRHRPRGTVSTDPAQRVDGPQRDEGDFVEHLRARREARHALIIGNPQPVDSVHKM